MSQTMPQGGVFALIADGKAEIPFGCILRGGNLIDRSPILMLLYSFCLNYESLR